MMMRRLAAPLAALLCTATLITGAGPAFAARGEKADREAEEEAEAKAKQEEAIPCPEEFWTVPVQIEGLACVLLLPKDEKAQDKEKESKQEEEEKETKSRR